MSSKAAKRRGRPIIVDGTRYYWKVRMEFGQEIVDVLLPTRVRIQVLAHEVTGSPYDNKITPGKVADFIRRSMEHA